MGDNAKASGSATQRRTGGNVLLAVLVGGGAVLFVAGPLVLLAAMAVFQVFVHWLWYRWALVAVVAGVVGVAAATVGGGLAPAGGEFVDVYRHVNEHGPTWAAWLGGIRTQVWPFGPAIAAALMTLGLAWLDYHDDKELTAVNPIRRQRRDDHSASRHRRRSRRVPVVVDHNGERAVGLGRWIEGDLVSWRHSRGWGVVPTGMLERGMVIVGRPGSGKTETILRLADGALQEGFHVYLLDAKADPETAQRFGELCDSQDIEHRVWPDDPIDMWRGDAIAIRNRLVAVEDLTESPYHAAGTRRVLQLVCGAPDGPPRSFSELSRRLDRDTLARLWPDGSAERAEILGADLGKEAVAGTARRYRALAGQVHGLLDGTWSWEDTRAAYVSLDGIALADDTVAVAHMLFTDFSAMVTGRKPPDRKVLLIADEFSALRIGEAAAHFERLRSRRAGLVVASQSVPGLHHDPIEQARLLDSAAVVIAHAVNNAEDIANRAGTTTGHERSWQIDDGLTNYNGSVRVQDQFRVDPNLLRQLPTGQAVVVSGGKAAVVAVSRSADEDPDSDPTSTTPFVDGPIPIDPLPDIATGPVSSGPIDDPSDGDAARF